MRLDLIGQTVVVIGGSAGIGLETARRARAEGASLILTARNAGALALVARELGAHHTAAFDAHDPASLQAFFRDLPDQIDHVMVTAGAPFYRPPLEISLDEARQGLTSHLILALSVAQNAAKKVKPSGSLTFMGGTGARRPRMGTGVVSTATRGFSRAGCQSCARTCANPRQPDCRRIRRYTALGNDSG